MDNKKPNPALKAHAYRAATGLVSGPCAKDGCGRSERALIHSTYMRGYEERSAADARPMMGTREPTAKERELAEKYGHMFVERDPASFTLAPLEDTTTNDAPAVTCTSKHATGDGHCVYCRTRQAERARVSRWLRNGGFGVLASAVYRTDLAAIDGGDDA